MRLAILSLLCLAGISCARQQGKVFPYNSSYDLSATEQAALVRKADAGDGAAAARLSLYYAIFQGDAESALLWLKRAATLGDVPSQYNLGRELLRQGNPREARLWLARAAKAGDADARRVLAEELPAGR